MAKITFERLAELRQGLTDAQIIGDAKQPGDDFVDTHETYVWYHAIAAAKVPWCILEMGVRYGYSAIAMILGTRASDSRVNPIYIGLDNEYDGIPSNSIAHRNIYRNAGVSNQVHSIDTGDIESVRLVVGPKIWDIVHVDGDHSEQGILNELTVAEKWVAADGLVLVDDIDTEHVRIAAEKFASKYGVIPMHIPTFHDMYLIDMGRSSGKRLTRNYTDPESRLWWESAEKAGANPPKLSVPSQKRGKL